LLASPVFVHSRSAPTFIRTRTRKRLKRQGVATYYQAVESYRDDAGKPRHRILASWCDASQGGLSVALLRGHRQVNEPNVERAA
jgi:hypothetical protein